MNIEFDSAKSERNRVERHLPFSRVLDFDWSDAVIGEDVRHAYAEPRYIAVGYLEKRLHVLCFTPIKDGIRAISFRKANKREAMRNGKPINR